MHPSLWCAGVAKLFSIINCIILYYCFAATTLLLLLRCHVVLLLLFYCWVGAALENRPLNLLTHTAFLGVDQTSITANKTTNRYYEGEQVEIY